MQATMSYGAPGCLSLAGTVLDDFVAGQVLQVLAPASLELSLAAEQALRAERVQLEGHWQQRLKRARYEVERAARQYEQLLENLSRKDVAPIRGSPYNLMAYDIVLHNFRSSLYKRGPLCGRFNSNFPIRLCPR
jgi:hypothetical protein